MMRTRRYSAVGVSLVCGGALAWCCWSATGQVPQKGRPLALGNIGTVSIETGDDHGINEDFLKCAVQKLNPSYRHGDTHEAFQLNLPNKPNLDAIGLVVGHGYPGAQCTGKGDMCGTYNDPIVVGNANVTFWQQFVQHSQGKFKSLTLLGCEIAQEDRGCYVLSQVAKTVQMPVRAPNSQIYCGPRGFTIDDGGDWVEATPTTPPPPSKCAGPKHVRLEQNEYTFRVDSKPLSVPTSAIRVLEFGHRTLQQPEFQTIPLDTKSLLQIVDFGSYFETSGRPGAVATGYFRIEINLGVRTIERSFRLYNDDLLEDLAEQDAFYRADKQRLLQFLNR